MEKRHHKPWVSVHERFCEIAGRHPELIAIDQVDRQATYAELARESARLANVLAGSGVGQGSIVGLLAESTIEIAVAILAILEEGGVFVPMDPHAPRARLQGMAEETRPHLWLVEPRFRDLAAALAVGDSQVLTLPLGEDPVAAKRPRRSAADPDAMCYIYYTSGSTGRPKGICGRSKGVDHFIRWEAETLEAGVGLRVSQLSAPTFDAFLRDLFLPFWSGGTVCAPLNREMVLDAPALLSWLESCRVEVVHCVPTLLRMLLGQGLKPENLPQLRWVLLAGETLSSADVKAWVEVFGGRIRLVNLYGPSETTMTKFCYFVEPQDGERRIIPIGQPIPGARAVIVNDRGELCAAGKVGEILIRTPYMSLGYYRQPELTEAAFIANPFSEDPTDIVYRTGDLGRVREDGLFDFLGRRDQQVKVRGVRVELGEVELPLRRHSKVTDAAVVVREDALGNRFLCAFVVAPQDLDLHALRRGLAEQLPEAMLPSLIEVLDEMPRTVTGKVDRRALAQRPLATEQGSGGQGPRNPLEGWLCQLWSEVLQRPKIGIHDNFFEHGGHSVLATQLLTRVREIFAVDLPLRSLFDEPTPAALARQVVLARGGQALPRLKPRPAGAAAALSFAQERLWFLDQLEPGNPAYNIHQAVRLIGPLDCRALEQSFGDLVRRHQSLRTRILEVEGAPVEVIDAPWAVPVPRLDLSRIEEARQEREMRRLSRQAGWRPFDLAAGKPLRVLLIRHTETRHVLVLTLHHIVSDAWSLGVLIDEVTAAYDARNEGRAPDLPALPLQYADFAHWQRAWLVGESLARELDFWRRELAGVADPLRLPTDHPRPPERSFRGRRQEWFLPAPLTDRLRALARRHHGSLFMSLLTGFYGLLHRLTGQEDICVGVPIAGREHVETEALIGLFVNTLVLRLQADPVTQGFGEVLGGSRETALRAFAHPHLPFEKLVEALAPRRDLGHSALFQVSLVMENVPAEQTDFGPLRVELVEADNESSKFDLTLFVVEQEEGLLGAFEYNSDLFDASTISRFAGQLRTLLAAAVDDPTVALADLPWLTAPQAHQLLAEFNDSRPPEELPILVETLFAEQALRLPEATAVVTEDEELSYAELARRANRLARFLRHQGVGQEVRVALLLGPSSQWLVAALGVLGSGGAYVPIDPTQPAQRRDAMLTESRASLVLTEEDVDFVAGVPAVCLQTAADKIALYESTGPVVNSSATNLAYVLFTSGSTGRPKGVEITRGALASYVRGVIAKLRLAGPGISFAAVSTLNADLVLTVVYPALVTGGCLHLISAWRALDPDAFAAAARQRPFDVLKIVPSHLEALLEASRPQDVLPRRLLVLGGEATSTALARRIAAFVTCKIVNHYGPTEATVGALVFQPGSRPWHTTTMPLGRPLPEVEAHVLDRRLWPVPLGAVGEIYLGGGGLARGYSRRPAQTAKRFLPHPHSQRAGQRLYATGDRARRLSSGDLEFLGRGDTQVKIRGYRIELGEIEVALRQLPEVREAVVLARADHGSELRLVAYLAGPAELSVDEIRETLGRRLPEVMLPTVVVVLASLPLTANGKVDRRALPPPPVGSLTPATNEDARTPVEELLIGLWARYLGLDRVELDGDFFALGGHSLLATRVIAQVRRTLEVEISVRELFEAPTPRSFARRVARARRSGPAASFPIVPVVGDEPRPLSFEQQRLWVAHQMAPEDPYYNRCDGLQIHGPLRVDVLASCLGQVIARHEILRTRFPAVDGQPVQVASPFTGFELPLLDLRKLDDAARDQELEHQSRVAMRRPFDLAAGPMLRANVLWLGEDQHALLLAMHHIIWDAWSIEILMREVLSLYRALSAGRSPNLTPLAVQYGDFAYWQRKASSEEIVEQQLAYWRRQLAGISEPLELPTDRPRSDPPDLTSGQVGIELSETLVRDLRSLSLRQGATLFMTLLAAFKVLLHCWAGARDVVVGVPTGQRSRPELEGLIGFFINMLVLRSELSANLTFGEVVHRVRSAVLDAYSNLEVPLERILGVLDLPRERAYGILMQNQFVLTPVQPLESGIEAWTWSPLTTEKETVQFDLNMSLVDDGQTLRGNLFYNAALFDVTTAQGLVDQWLTILRAVTEDASVRLNELEAAVASSGRQKLKLAGPGGLRGARRKRSSRPRGGLKPTPED